MKKCLFTTVFALFVSLTATYSQTIEYSSDSVSKLLCRVWQAEYAMRGKMKIGNNQSIDFVFSFNTDNTFSATSKKANDTKNGTWAYDQKNKVVMLTVNGKNLNKLITLTDKEMVMASNTEEATPDDPTLLKVYFKAKE